MGDYRNRTLLAWDKSWTETRGILTPKVSWSRTSITTKGCCGLSIQDLRVDADILTGLCIAVDCEGIIKGLFLGAVVIWY